MDVRYKDKVTRGPWNAYGDFDVWDAFVWYGPAYRNPADQIQVSDLSCHSKVLGETYANALLIAEAGTVLHETGFTPRELSEQRDKLLSAIRPLLLCFESQNEILLRLGNPDFVAMRDAAREAIAACESDS